MSLPTITVIGNLKRIETKFTSSGKQVTSFQIECSEKNSKGEYENLYLKGECWENAAKFVNDFFNDGSPAIVTGKLYTNVYQKQDGTKAYETKLLFPSVSFVPKDRSDATQQTKPQTHQRQELQYEYQNAQGRPTQAPQRQMPQQPPVIDIDSDDILF
jgi:single stranded DNA-binding protein